MGVCPAFRAACAFARRRVCPVSRRHRDSQCALSWALCPPQQANFDHVQNLHCVTHYRSASSSVGRFAAAQFVIASTSPNAVPSLWLAFVASCTESR
jgi:hypothetical protein